MDALKLKWTRHPPNLWTCGRFKIEDLGPEHNDIGQFFLQPDSSCKITSHHTLADAMSEAEKMENAV